MFLSSGALFSAVKGLIPITIGSKLMTKELHYSAAEILEKFVCAGELFWRKEVEMRKLSVEITFIFI